jgi:hypothetical protein
METTWTPERVEILNRLFEEGLPTSEIGRRMGLTKNTIIGRLHRNGMSRPETGKQPPRIDIPAARDCPVKVIWADWGEYHDWVGRRSLRTGVKRKPKPPQEKREFVTREATEQFMRLLRDRIPEDELVLQILDPPSPPPARPVQQRLPGEWPLQRRCD